MTHSGVGDAGGIRRIGFARPAGVQESGPGGQGGRDVHDVLAGGGQQLGDATAQAGRALDGEAAVRPAGGPAD